jgi:hypothetical protein
LVAMGSRVGKAVEAGDFMETGPVVGRNSDVKRELCSCSSQTLSSSVLIEFGDYV